MAKVSDQLRTDYRRILRRARADGNDQAIGNRYPWQCREAVQELLDFARERQEKSPSAPIEVLVVTASFPNYVFGCEQTVKNAQLFLQRGGKIRVLIWAQSPKVAENDMYVSCKQLHEFTVRKTGRDDLADKVPHFLVVDGIAFRLESPHPVCPAGNFDDFRPEIPARINFNDPILGAELMKLFERQWSALSHAI